MPLFVKLILTTMLALAISIPMMAATTSETVMISTDSVVAGEVQVLPDSAADSVDDASDTGNESDAAQLP